MIEADIYCLTLYDKNTPYNVYIPKALWDDEEFVKQRGHKWGEYILVYPFLDEKWHSNIDCNDIYCKKGNILYSVGDYSVGDSKSLDGYPYQFESYIKKRASN